MISNSMYKVMDFSKPMGTYRWVNKVNNKKYLAKLALIAMARINQCEQGTVNQPYNLASSVMKDGRTLIQTIYEDGYVSYNDGHFIVECDETGTLYVDVTGLAISDCSEYKDMEFVMDAVCRELLVKNNQSWITGLK